MTTSAYPALTEAQKVFKDLIWTPMIKAGEVWLEGQVPFLALPVVRQLDEFAIQQISDALFNQIVIFIDVTAIRLVNAELQTKWARASTSLSIIAQEQGANSDAYKKALQTATDEFAAWVHTGPQLLPVS